MLLKNFNLKKMLMMRTDVLIVGSGIAGLNCALNIDSGLGVLVTTKRGILSGSTPHSQGGIAGVLSSGDSYESHIKDTLIAGDGHCIEESVEILIKEGPERIKELINIGVEFDREGGDLAFTKEGAHSHRRILHSNGDATGLAIEKALANAVKCKDNIIIRENFYVIDLLIYNNICCGAVGYDLITKQYIAILAKVVVMATGGIGCLYRETTNPEENTGDGISLCYRAGCELTDLEFIQFHPTTLYIAGAPRFLISESVRGEGAYLRNANKERFMFNYDERGELASRDIVSRAINFEMIKTESSNIYLDLSHLSKEMIRKRFPTIRKTCLEYGIDILNEFIPVRPSAHYFMGGIKVDINGKTNIDFLYACGECACNGVQGANRLASNSLLEGAVFSYRIAKQIDKLISKAHYINITKIDIASYPKKYSKSFNLLDAVHSLRSLMWREVGIIRNAARLKLALELINYWESYILSRDFDIVEGFELQNMLILGKLIVKSALWREESRGSHYREDFPDKKEEFKGKRLIHKID